MLYSDLVKAKIFTLSEDSMVFLQVMRSHYSKIQMAGQNTFPILFLCFMYQNKNVLLILKASMGH